MTARLIPRLDIKGPNLVKGIQFEGLRVLGKPHDFARFYYDEGADELLYMDVVASLYGRNSLVEIVERTAKEVFVPLTVGGGLRSVDDIRAVLRAGADKVSLNTAVVNNPDLVSEAARIFGSSTIVVSIEAMRHRDGRCRAYVDYGRQETGVDVVGWAVEMADRGAGEIMVTSIDRDGTGRGLDLQLTRQVADSVPIPVIASGGVGRMEDVAEGILDGRADAVCLASLLHYNHLRHPASEFGSAADGHDQLLRGRAAPRDFSRAEDAGLFETRERLRERGIECRH